MPRLSLRGRLRPAVDRSAHAVARTPPGARDAGDGAHERVTLAPIWLAVLVQMLGVGVTLSTLPLYLHALGCSANQRRST